jgi:hypothetical protein
MQVHSGYTGTLVCKSVYMMACCLVLPGLMDLLTEYDYRIHIRYV